MRGWSCASSAALVSAGTLSRWTKRTGSPALAAHAAAGIAKAGSSAETTSTRSLVVPRAAVWNASSARVARRLGQLGPVGEQHRGTDGGGGQHGAGDAGAPVARVDEGHGGGARLGARGGEDGA